MKTKSITKIAILTALFAIIAPIVIPFGLVPISLSTLILCVMSAILKPKEIIISMVLYIIIGLIGIPVFASFQGGFGVLVGPTGGYLIGYIFAGFVMSLLNNIVKKKWIYIISFLIGTIILYVFGTVHFMFVMDMTFKESIVITVYQFVVGDLIESIIALIICYILNKIFTNYQ